MTDAPLTEAYIREHNLMSAIFDPEAEPLKQIIVIRTDTVPPMRKGKMVAQGAHASNAIVTNHRCDPRVQQWLSDSFTKVVVRADSEADLLLVKANAEEAGLLSALITDQGKTEFGGVPTITALAVGPDTDAKLNPVTGNLKLL